ncbi:Jac1 [Giardia muris]|uniref:Jac1 n=1 Tax=Giardia muris TaxID=5742 RepID=A0A4Z1T298_GIAMU|nr:Jac1 [Giardia muris]|eukprot:TNJ26709.1 Jac1 [Giardia muris]
MLTRVPASLSGLVRCLRGHCWRCRAPAKALFCEQCQAPLPVPSNLDHFRLLGVPTEYSLDQKELGRRFRQLQARVHPDALPRFNVGRAGSTTSSDEEYALSLASTLSARLNNAYDTLRDDMRRAEYVASLQNISAAAASPALLIDQLVMRDQIEKSAKDRDVSTLERMQEALKERFQVASQAFGEALVSKDPTTMGHLLCEMRFVTSTLTDLKRRISGIDILSDTQLEDA